MQTTTTRSKVKTEYSIRELAKKYEVPLWSMKCAGVACSQRYQGGDYIKLINLQTICRYSRLHYKLSKNKHFVVMRDKEKNYFVSVEFMTDKEIEGLKGLDRYVNWYYTIEDNNVNQLQLYIQCYHYTNLLPGWISTGTKEIIPQAGSNKLVGGYMDCNRLEEEMEIEADGY